MRESKIAEEEEVQSFSYFKKKQRFSFSQWLGKMAQAGRAGTETAAQDKDKDMTERNPLWLRDKGK